MSATPRPWTRCGDYPPQRWTFYAPDGLGEQSGPVLEVLPRRGEGEREANAAFLDRAVNSRDELVAALEAIAEFQGKTLLGPQDEPEFDRGHQIGANKAFGQCADIARAALSRARGEAG